MTIVEDGFVIGQYVPWQFIPPIIVAAYLASLVGCLLTVELLHRRATALRTLKSFIWTVACSFAFGVIGIWCMHFIGNRAINLAGGQEELQLVYNSGFTVLSVFLPVLGLILAFSAAEYPSHSATLRRTARVVTGIFAGLSIVGMHYVGNLGISNYSLHYSPRFFVASVIIAIGDCLCVLVLFYAWREKWISSFLKRMGCAAFLAAGVSSMHFTASVGCTYRLKRMDFDRSDNTRNIQIIVAGCLCCFAALLCLGVLFFTRHRSRKLQGQATKIMLACAYFDEDGNIMVTNEGILPSREVTDRYAAKTFDDVFGTSHSVFHWCFQVTRNWSSVIDLIPKMRDHLSSGRATEREGSKPPSSGSSSIYDPETYSDYSKIFRESFCVAAASLADALEIPLPELGVLYDKFIDTGTLRGKSKIKLGPDVEANYARGHLLFLVRKLSKKDSDDLLNTGYKFTQVSRIERTLVQTIQIPKRTLDTVTSDLFNYADTLKRHEKLGTYVSLFALVRSLKWTGWDVLVQSQCQFELPDSFLLAGEPTEWQHEMLRRLSGKRPLEIQEYLGTYHGQGQNTGNKANFALQICEAVEDLKLIVPAHIFNNAIFFGSALQAHYSAPRNGISSPTTLYSFIAVADVHYSVKDPALALIPASFLKVRSRCYAGSPGLTDLHREVHQEFGPHLARKAKKTSDKKSKFCIAMRTDSFGFGRKNAAITGFKELIGDAGSTADTKCDIFPPETDHSLGNKFGGILINNEVTIETDRRDSDVELNDLGVKNAITTAEKTETFIDKLDKITRSQWLSQVFQFQG